MNKVTNIRLEPCEEVLAGWAFIDFLEERLFNFFWLNKLPGAMKELLNVCRRRGIYSRVFDWVAYGDLLWETLPKDLIFKFVLEDLD